MICRSPLSVRQDISATCTTRKPLFHDLYGSYESCQAIHGSYLFDSIGQAWRAYSDMFLFSGLVPFYLMQDVLALNKFKEQRVKNMHSASYSINRPERGFAKRTYAQIAIECLEISKEKRSPKEHKIT